MHKSVTWFSLTRVWRHCGLYLRQSIADVTLRQFDHFSDSSKTPLLLCNRLRAFPIIYRVREMCHYTKDMGLEEWAKDFSLPSCILSRYSFTVRNASNAVKRLVGLHSPTLGSLTHLCGS